MLLEIPNEIVRNIIMNIDCIDHLEKVYICNKEFHKVLKQYWFFNHLLTIQKKTLNFKNKQLDKLENKYFHFRTNMECLLYEDSYTEDESSISSDSE